MAEKKNLRPKRTRSTVPLEEKERIAEEALKKFGYTPKERKRIIENAFYEVVKPDDL